MRDGVGPGDPRWSWSPRFRHECEVRHVARMRPVQQQHFLTGVAGKRGQAAGDKLAQDVATHLRLAQEIAEMETNALRAARLREIEVERGAEFAQGLRESAWAVMQERAAA